MATNIKNVIMGNLSWKDPISGRPMILMSSATTPSGVTMVGALRIDGTNTGYPIVDCVARLTPESASCYSSWLTIFNLVLPKFHSESFQSQSTVDSFGKQWHFAGIMRSEEDLLFRVARRFDKTVDSFAGKLVLDAGAGAGDQSRWLLDSGSFVVSLDLSDAINLTAGKLRGRSNWFGVQGDITNLPFNDSIFDIVYCEGVIQHTRDSELAVHELSRVTKKNGEILSTHYISNGRFLNRIRIGLQNIVRSKLCKMDEHNLLLLTGLIAKCAYIPVLGWMLKKTNLVLFQPKMPDFKTTWVNTHDCYGAHSFQRVISHADFRSYFSRKGLTIKKSDAGVIVAEVTSDN